MSKRIAGPATQVVSVGIGPLLDHQTETLGAIDVFEPERPRSGTRSLLVQALVNNIRFTIGQFSAPRTNTGFQLAAGDPPMIIPLGPGNTPRFIGEQANSVLEYQWAE